MTLQAIDTLSEKLAALEASLKTNLPERHIMRGCEPLNDRTEQEVNDGVINLVLDREHSYAKGRGRVAQEGTLDVMLIGYVSVDENSSDKAALQDAEAALGEQIKGWVRATGIDGFDVELDHIQLSRQLEFPYGWVIVALKLGPPKSNVY